MVKNFSVVDLTRSRAPKIVWEKVAQEVLDSKFEVSLVLIGEKRMAGLKRKYPPHGYSRAQAEDGRATNVLSFLIDKRAGEIFLCPRFIEREAPLFERSYKEHLLALYIHGLLHLKGFDHNNAAAEARMARAEEKYLSKFLNCKS
jgi:probable rRNA maturation factor